MKRNSPSACSILKNGKQLALSIDVHTEMKKLF